MKKITRKQKIRCAFWILTTFATISFYVVIAEMMLEDFLR